MKDSTFSLVFGSFDSLLYSPSQKTLNQLQKLSKNGKFTAQVFEARKLLNIQNLFDTKPEARKLGFEKELKLKSIEIQKKYIKTLYKILEDFELPVNYITTINYVIGAGIVMEPQQSFVIWKNEKDSGIFDGKKGLNLLILESMTIADIKEHIEENSDKIREEMKDLPKVKKQIIHKDGLKIGSIVALLKDSLGKRYSEIADIISDMEEDQYKFFGSSEPITLSDKEIATIYKRYKENSKI